MKYIIPLLLLLFLCSCVSTKNKYRRKIDNITTNLDSTYIKQLESNKVYIYEATQRADSIVITKDKAVIYSPKHTSKSVEKEEVKEEQAKEVKERVIVKKEEEETKEKFQIDFFYIILAIVIIYIVVKLINGGSFTNIKRLF